MWVARRAVLMAGVLTAAAEMGCHEDITDQLYASQPEAMLDRYGRELDEMKQRAKKNGAESRLERQLCAQLQQAREQLRHSPLHPPGPWQTIATRGHLLGSDIAGLLSGRVRAEAHGVPAGEP